MYLNFFTFHRSIGVVLLSLFLSFLQGCECDTEPYNFYTLEIYSQQLRNVNALPGDLEDLLKPLEDLDCDAKRCFCPTNRLDEGNGKKPYVTISRVDSVETLDQPHKLYLVQGTGEVATFGEYSNKIGKAIEKISLPESFSESNQGVSREIILDKIERGYSVFLLQTVGNFKSGKDVIKMGEIPLKVYTNSRDIIDSIGTFVCSSYTQLSGSYSESEISRSNRAPKVAVFYNLNWEEVRDPVFPRIAVKNPTIFEEESVTIVDESDPAGIMEGALWDFGDGTPLEEYNGKTVTHTYSRNGKYVVSLCSADKRHCPRTDTILVKERPVVLPPECEATVLIAAFPEKSTSVGRKITIEDKTIRPQDVRCPYRRIWYVNGEFVSEGEVLDTAFATPGARTVKLCINKETEEACKEITIKVRSAMWDLKIAKGRAIWNQVTEDSQYLVSVVDIAEGQEVMGPIKTRKEEFALANVADLLTANRFYSLVVRSEKYSIEEKIGISKDEDGKVAPCECN